MNKQGKPVRFVWLFKLKWVALMFVVMLVLLIWLGVNFADRAGGRGPPKPSKAVTYVLGPVDDEGYIDYVAALNEIRSRGIKPEENAAIGILRLFDPNSFAYEELFDELLPEGRLTSGPYFQTMLDAWLENHDKALASAELADFHDMVDSTSDELDAVFERPWSDDDFPWAAKWLAANSQFLDRFVIELNKPSIYFPQVVVCDPSSKSALYRSVDPGVVVMWKVEIALTVRAMHSISGKDYEKCVEDIAAIYTIAKRFGAGFCSGEISFASRMISDCFNIERQLIQEADFDSETWIELRRKLEALKSEVDLVRIVGIQRRFYLLGKIQGSQAGDEQTIENVGPSDSAYFRSADWTFVRQEINRYFDEVVAALQEKNPVTRKRILQELKKERRLRFNRVQQPLTWRETWFASRAVRSSFAADFFVSGDRGKMWSDPDFFKKFQAMQLLSQLGYAAKAYQIKHGDFPIRLQQLVPDFIDKIPDDPFTNKPMIYKHSATETRIYSIGRNRIDEDGDGSGYRNQEPDDIQLMLTRDVEESDQPQQP